ncbi:DUF5011 domain-containing protein, partial [Candidatus Babeliales bacterium]|nr:DUF5011 domain-containing protein [Candidatus Babeliales bacterium]
KNKKERRFYNMAKTYKVLEVKRTILADTVNDMELKEDAFSVDFYHKPGVGTMAIITAYNDDPVITDLGGSTSINNDQAEPTWSSYVSYADVDSTNLTLVIDDSAVEMVIAGTFDVTWTLTDGWGATDVLTKTITIVDVTLPVITDSVGNTTFEVHSAEPTWATGVTALDETDGDITSSIVITDAAAAMGTVGNFNILYNVDDAATNSAVQVTRVITIEDTTAPVLAGILADYSAEHDTVEPTWTAGVTSIDNYDGDITVGIVITESVNMAVIGDYVVGYSSTDANGNIATGSLTFTVEDTVAPVFSGAGAVDAVSYEYGTAEPSWDTNVISTDAYDGVITGGIVITFDPNVDMDTVGTFDVIYTSTDTSMNEAILTKTVTIEDTTIPVITASNANVDTEDASVWVSSATAADDYDGDVTSSMVITYFKADGTTPLATLADARTDLYAGLNVKVNYNVDDANGNSATEVIITLTAVDNTLPVITASSETINVSATATWTDSATASDNKDGAISPLTIAYFENDNATPIGNLATFRTYINNTGAGETGYVHYDVDDAAANSAVQVEISITATV